ncbi:S-adenosyl-L-methionine-dependent methyltransferase [Dentipellis sp. KUC8613]|nr:S-adenosyl-L-methionine-dependent methyltransferase [Dentipellis sp. KUC8613]
MPPRLIPYVLVPKVASQKRPGPQNQSPAKKRRLTSTDSSNRTERSDLAVSSPFERPPSSLSSRNAEIGQNSFEKNSDVGLSVHGHSRRAASKSGSYNHDNAANRASENNLHPLDSGVQMQHNNPNLHQVSASPASFIFPIPAPGQSHDDISQCVLYDVADDELVEDENLHIMGETEHPEDLDGNNSTEDDVPVRLLSDFSIYKMESLELVHIAELLSLGSVVPSLYGASGTVKPWVQDDEDDEDEDEDKDEDDNPEDDDVADEDGSVGQAVNHIKLSAILEFNIHDVSEETGALDIKMYLKTKYAWYILGLPADTYLPFFVKFWLQHRLLHLVVSTALDNPRTALPEFVQSLGTIVDPFDAFVKPHAILGRNIVEEDLHAEDVKNYMFGVLEDLQAENIKLGRVPLVRSLFSDNSASVGHLENTLSIPKYFKPQKKSTHGHSRAVHLNLEQEVLSHHNKTAVLPVVNRVAEDLFLPQPVLIATSVLDAPKAVVEDSTFLLEKEIEHSANPSLSWGKRGEHPPTYSSVKIDGLEYHVGDIVIIEPGTDADETRAQNYSAENAQTSNFLGNNKWFAKICYMFEDKGKKWFHGQWLSHSSKTILQEVAHSHRLFLMDICDDIELGSIIKKANVRQLHLDEIEPCENGFSVENSFFFSSHYWNEDDSSFIELANLDEIEALALCKPHQQCIPCGLRKREQRHAELTVHPDGFSQHGIEYHRYDFVYLLQEVDSDLPYQFAQILQVKRSKQDDLHIRVQIFGHVDDVVRRERRDNPNLQNWKKDESHLFATSKTLSVSSDQIAGKCFVAHEDSVDDLHEWLIHDHFYVSHQAISTSARSHQDLSRLDPDNFHQCSICYPKHMSTLKEHSVLLKSNQPLSGLELFAGAGGLSAGLNEPGFVKTKWAVEFSPSCSLTMKRNHPDITVYNQCCNLLLQHAVETYEGKDCPPLVSLHDGKTILPPMPQPGEVDFIYGGLPCQSYSMANHHKKVIDKRSTLVCNMISYVEFYRPGWFLLENVVGLLLHPLKGEQEGQKIVGGIKMGVVKFILRSLTSLGYQVSFRVLQAGQYGAPQGRKRVIFWGAKLGLPLPSFPIPTHFFQKQGFFNLPTGAQLPPPSRSLIPGDYNQGAPKYPVTVEDAIGDLPTFDWQNPHNRLKASKLSEAEALERLQKGIEAFSAVSGSAHYSGFNEAEEYASSPLTRYQETVRQGAGETVTAQYTQRFAADVVERVVNIPLHPGADWSNLPPELSIGKRAKGGYKKLAVITQHMIGVYERIDKDGKFRTAMTTVSPNSKGSCMLHYSIGNAVPVPLARALGKSIGNSLLKMWKEDARETSPEV